ncbi:hypothetical protein NDI56_13140 [Haloarcula sp. S1CR25-12]|uniref:DUF8080 domain-containing protein n=1 Tax=Haloarcula saliterrae TaxID=2950534 RepID=A0ABU2FDK6_9EURY|nr:hypothetical protein [Haloarcula sp. S1CR25-12]MDS0260342.1 hypothetical protein [Haloarcula sp. S1CR25-12]
MVTFDCTTSHHDGVTLVAAYLRDIEVPTRVAVRNRLDGPVWPPRSEGLPEAGWTETGFSGVVGSGSTALGYATPAPPAEPPAELVDAVTVPDAERTETPADVVRELGDPSPPSDAIPAADGPGTAAPRATDSLAPAVNQPTTDGPETRGASLADAQDTDSSVEPAPDSPDERAQLPSAVGPWMAEMARRVETAEALSAAETVPDATDAVRDAGGLAEVRALADAPDERRLRLVARRARRLAQRRSAATVPVETLSTLA